METQTCESCETKITEEADLEVESVPVAETVDDGVPKYGTKIGDLYRCKGCGKPYALKSA